MVVAHKLPEVLALPGSGSAVARACAGDAQAFAEVMQQYERPVYTLILGLVRNAEDAEDVAQETWFKVARALPQLRNHERIGPWVFRIARNTALNFIQARKYRQQTSLEETDFAGADADEPEQHVLSLDERRKVWETLGGLKERDRTALFLREFQGLSYAEIGSALRISRSTAEVVLFRARERFRKLYQQTDAVAASPCKIAPLQLSAMIDGELSPEACPEVREHLRDCRDCRDWLQTMTVGRKLFRNFGLLTVPPSVTAAVHAKVAGILGWGTAAGAGAAASGGGVAAALTSGIGGSALLGKIAAVVLSVSAITAVAVHEEIIPSPARHVSHAKEASGWPASSGPIAYEPASEPASTPPGAPQPTPQGSAFPVAVTLSSSPEPALPAAIALPSSPERAEPPSFAGESPQPPAPALLHVAGPVITPEAQPSAVPTPSPTPPVDEDEQPGEESEEEEGGKAHGQKKEHDSKEDKTHGQAKAGSEAHGEKGKGSPAAASDNGRGKSGAADTQENPGKGSSSAAANSGHGNGAAADTPKGSGGGNSEPAGNAGGAERSTGVPGGAGDNKHGGNPGGGSEKSSGGQAGNSGGNDKGEPKADSPAPQGQGNGRNVR